MPDDQTPGGKSDQHEQETVKNIGERGTVPGRQDREGVDSFFAGAAIVGARADAEAILAGAKTAIVRFSLPAPA